MNYLNEYHKTTAEWLRRLSATGRIPEAFVDDRSITEVLPQDIAGYGQAHFFAGIAGWCEALRLAGFPETVNIWTGSPPCQPFSVAGKQKGKDDERHLAPVWLELIRQCRPTIIAGEQVAAAIAKGWIDDLQVHLEREGYAVGYAVLPACNVGAPHKRERLFFCAYRLDISDADRHLLANHDSQQRNRSGTQWSGRRPKPTVVRSIISVANSNDHRQQSGSGCGSCSESPAAGYDVGRRSAACELAYQQRDGRERGLSRRPRKEWQAINGSTGCGSTVDGLANTSSVHDNQCHHNAEHRRALEAEQDRVGGGNNDADPLAGFWAGADWLGCRDGKFRPVEPGTQPLANGVSNRVVKLRGFGNAIVPQVAAEFLKAFMDTFK